MERVVRAPVDPIRFRGNFFVDGADAWEEMHWPGHQLSIGTVELQVVEPIGRCAATNVNPVTGERDLNIPKSLNTGFGHVICGVYAKVSRGGDIKIGDEVKVA